jgi:predicted membrane metal-binding protein
MDTRSKRIFWAPFSASRALKTSSGSLVFRDSYLATKNVSAVVEATSVWPVDEELGWIGRVHRRTDAALGYGLRPQEAAVVRGMVLGDRSLIPEDLEVDFRRSGITHVLTISSQHVAVLAARLLGCQVAPIHCTN